jgi:hypothetical protein
LRFRNCFRRYRERRVLFSCFARPGSFSMVPRASFPFSCFALPDSFSAVPRASGPVFMFCAPGLVFGGAECVGSCFHVLLARTHFRRSRERRVPFSCFARPGIISVGTEGVVSRFHILCARTHLRRSRGIRVPFSCFALLDSFSAVPIASGPVFKFCAHGLIFGGTKGVGSLFNGLCSHTRFRRYRELRVPFSYFPLPDSFSAVLTA